MRVCRLTWAAVTVESCLDLPPPFGGMEEDEDEDWDFVEVSTAKPLAKDLYSRPGKCLISPHRCTLQC